MNKVKPTFLRQNLYKILDEILETGEPITIDRDGETLKLSLERPKRIDIRNLKRRDDVIIGNPDDLVNLSWEDEVHLDLP